jgi:hypothetical protein
MGKQAFK